MSEVVKSVKVQVKRSRGKEYYMVQIPSAIASQLKIKGGDTVIAELIHDYKGRKAVVFYKP